ncbi:MAG: MMPL family transporter, partial [Pseudomonadales bacterium]|nr:MMPL family transporter [Pseudomonadales bacterium]
MTINITAALGCVGAGAWFGVELNMLSTTAIILTLIIANVDTLHISTTYLKELKNGLNKEAAMSASLQRNFTAILLTSLTTIGAFLGFNFVGVAGISDLGNFTMLGVTVAFILSFTLFPALALKWSNPDPEKGLDQNKIAKAISDFSLGYRRPLFVLFALLVIGFAPFAANNRFNDDLLNYFDDDTEIGQALAVSVDEMGRHKTIEYVIDSGSKNGVYNPDYLNKVDQFVTWYSAQENVTKIISLTNILKRINQVMHNDDPQWSKVPDSSDLASQYTLLYGFSATTDDLLKDDSSALHLTVILNHMDDTEFLALENKAQQWFTSRYPETGFQGTSFDSMLTKAGETTVIGMKKGFIVTLLFVTLVMVVGLRSIKYGLISLIPNLIPGLVIYGVWGVFVGEMG